MDAVNPAAEYLRIAEHYRQMKDEELLELVPQSDELTPAAQQALAAEMQHRGLKIEAKAENKEPRDQTTAKPPAFVLLEPAQSHDSYGYDSSASGDDSLGEESAGEADANETDSYEEERKLVELCTVWSQRDALKIQRILDVAGIPFFMGPEKATGVDEVTSNFTNGVSVRIMQIAMPWAGPLMQNYEPEDDPSPPEDEIKDASIRCPRCNSTDVVFDGLGAAAAAPGDNSSQKFRWTCDACGNQWEDEGVGREE